ncbi:MAG: exonuclease domain-containing protein [Lachnospiraceae bacterium]|jgi:inhibitor of KinA sporulation pathway (predicted exonuclease)|nr:exonuclease domain-containing protein [Lachnospiraceae bacterium]
MKSFIVFDLEWNQSPEGKFGTNEKLPFEIIEIGAVKLSESFEFVSEFHELVKPKIYRRMHYKITEVTHMAMSKLKRDGKEFPAVLKSFLRWCGDDPMFCTWGPMDLTQLQKNMTYYGIPFPYRVPLFYYDVQKLYAIQRGDEKNKPSLDRAIDELELTEDRPFHRALDDAYYTGKVFCALNYSMVKPYLSLDCYQIPASEETEIYLKFPTYTKYVSHGYPSKEEAMENKRVREIKCPDCGRALRKKIQWFASGQKYFYAIGICKEHGLVRGKIRIKKAEDQSTYVVKTIKLSSDSEFERIKLKRDEVRKRRSKRAKNHLLKQQGEN